MQSTPTTRPLLDLSRATIATPGGRVLFDALTLALTDEHVALVGRNGVGKSTLLGVLAGEIENERVKRRGTCAFVPQLLAPRADERTRLAHRADERTRVAHFSRGELRRERLTAALRARPDLLLLDEPTDDLDEVAVAWLRAALRDLRGGLVVATHDRRLLRDFRHFFLARESGCRIFSGTLAGLDEADDRAHIEGEQRYASGLARLADAEERILHLARRKARKKQYGRCRELDRATSRARLNQKRDHAQVSHGKAKGVRETRIAAVRDWSHAARRALDVRLALELSVPALPANDPRPFVVLAGVSAIAAGAAGASSDRTLFRAFDLHVARDRIAVIGPNGAGKTTLLDIMLGRRAPTTGIVRADHARIGSIAQGAGDWMRDESLFDLLHSFARPAAPATGVGGAASIDAHAAVLVAHKFPLALAERPLRSLSPGERARAALICLFERDPPVELLVLDEPTFALDSFGTRALAAALAKWPGGLVVASHDADFLASVGFDRTIDLRNFALGPHTK